MITTQAILKHKYDSPSGNVSYLLFHAEENFSFNEGQFMMLEVTIDGIAKKKPYSIATTNRMIQEEKLIGFIVKKASEQGVSNFLTQTIQLGDSITMK
jgi:ferredoxin-NADP reductase